MEGQQRYTLKRDMMSEDWKNMRQFLAWIFIVCLSLVTAPAIFAVTAVFFFASSLGGAATVRMLPCAVNRLVAASRRSGMLFGHLGAIVQ